jgi:hypothetical protein
MQSTGKSGRWANIYAVASNGFTGGGFGEEDDVSTTDIDVSISEDDEASTTEDDVSTADDDASPDNDDASTGKDDCRFTDNEDTNKGPSRRKRGMKYGAKKTACFFAILKCFEAELWQEEHRIGDKITIRKAHFRKALLQDADAEIGRQAETMAMKVMRVAEVEKTQNALQRVHGEDLPSQLYGYYSYSALSKNANIDELVKELHARGMIEFNKGQGVKHGVTF